MTTCRKRTVFEDNLIEQNMDMTKAEAKDFFFKKFLTRFAETLVEEGHIQFVFERVGDVYSPETEERPSDNPNDYFLEFKANFAK